MHITTYRKRSLFYTVEKVPSVQLELLFTPASFPIKYDNWIVWNLHPRFKNRKTSLLRHLLKIQTSVQKYRNVGRWSFQQITFCNVNWRTITKNCHHRCCNDWSWILQLRLFTAKLVFNFFVYISVFNSQYKKSQTNKAMGDPTLILVLWEMNCQQNAKGPAGRWSSWIFNAFPNVKHSHWWRYLIFAVEENAVINSLALQASQSNVNHLFEVIHLQNQKIF